MTAAPAPEKDQHKHRHGFAHSHVSLGALRAVTTLATILATDKIKDPSARWATISGISIASGIGESLWREHVEREREGSKREAPVPSEHTKGFASTSVPLQIGSGSPFRERIPRKLALA